jgi:putative ABC transport system substrate-binding protein
MEAKRTVGGGRRTAASDPFQKAGLNSYDGSFWPLGTRMRRRQFITLLGGAAATWPVAAHAQQGGKTKRIGWLATSTASSPLVVPRRLAAFKRGLADLGWVEGRNLAFEERWAEGSERLPSLAAELAALRPDLIFVASSPNLAAVRRATGTIPIVFASVTDPVGQGFVSSLAQPGGNITGFADSEFSIATKDLDLLKKIAPALTRVGFIYDPAQPMAVGAFAAVEPEAAALGVELAKTPVRNAGEIERAINALAQTPNVGLFVLGGSAIGVNENLINALAIRHRLPAIYETRFSVVVGGLASYGSDDLDLSRRAASYADRILKGEKPADLPVQLPTKFELVLNLKTARAMGLVIPESLLALADEVIE